LGFSGDNMSTGDHLRVPCAFSNLPQPALKSPRKRPHIHEMAEATALKRIHMQITLPYLILYHKGYIGGMDHGI